MTQNNGPTITDASTISRDELDEMLKSSQNTWVTPTGPNTTDTLPGTLPNSGDYYFYPWKAWDGMGTSTITPPQPFPSAPVGDSLTLTKTAGGEFVLTGSGDTLKLLMDYFLQSPEMWLRLAAMKSELEEK